MASKGKNYVLDTETEKPDEAEEDNSTEEESSDTETPEEDAPEKGDSKSDVSLTDLNDDPFLLDALTDEQLKSLNEEAHQSDVPLGGTLRSDLHRRASAISTEDNNSEG
jgi:hypothetical protein